MSALVKDITVDDVTSFFKTPGGSLSGRDRDRFEAIKAVVERCTVDLLIRSDWEANLQCVDLCNSETNPAVLQEVVFLLKRKLSSGKPRVISLAMALAEALVKNCGIRVHAAIGSDFFMKEMAKVARKFNGKTGSENREILEQCLDIIQAWGEAFLPRQQQYPGFVKYYFELRREGLPFSSQFDQSRVPVFTPEASQQQSTQMEEDAILAAALAASLASEDAGGGGGYDNPRFSRSQTYPSTSYDSSAYEMENTGIASGFSGGPDPDVPDTLYSALILTTEIFLAYTSPSEAREDEMAAELLQQLQRLHQQMQGSIEYAAVSNPEAIEGLFKLSTDTQEVIGLFQGVARGSLALSHAKDMIKALRICPASSVTPLIIPPDNNNNLLQFDSSPPPPAASPTTAATKRRSSLLSAARLAISFTGSGGKARENNSANSGAPTSSGTFTHDDAYSGTGGTAFESNPLNSSSGLRSGVSSGQSSSNRHLSSPKMEALKSFSILSNPLKSDRDKAQSLGSPVSGTKITSYTSGDADPFGPSVGIDSILGTSAESSDPFGTAPAPTAAASAGGNSNTNALLEIFGPNVSSGPGPVPYAPAVAAGGWGAASSTTAQLYQHQPSALVPSGEPAPQYQQQQPTQSMQQPMYTSQAANVAIAPSGALYSHAGYPTNANPYSNQGPPTSSPGLGSAPPPPPVPSLGFVPLPPAYEQAQQQAQHQQQVDPFATLTTSAIPPPPQQQQQQQQQASVNPFDSY